MLATTSRRTDDWNCCIHNSPLNYTDPTGTTQAGNPLTNLNVYAGGYSGNKVTKAKPLNPYIASANSGPKIPAVNFAGGINSYSTSKAVDQYYVDQGLKNLSNPLSGAGSHNFAAPTSQQLLEASLNPQGKPTKVQAINSTIWGDKPRSIAPALNDSVQNSKNPWAVGAAQFFKPVASIVGNIAGGIIDTILPPSDPTYIATYPDGTRNLYIGEGPSTQSYADFGLLVVGGGPRSIPRPGAQLTAHAPSSGRGIWDLTPEARWTAVEQQLGKNLPSNYPVVDKFNNGLATSIKSLDLGAPTYAKPDAITRVGEGYIDKVARFQGKDWAKVDIRANQITGRGLDLAVPPGATTAQNQALQDLVTYGRQKGVAVNIVETR